MNKSDLIEVLVGKASHLSHKEIELVVETVFDSMTNALSKGDRIEIRGFGCFEIRTRPARLARNPKTGDKVPVKERRVPFFKVGKELRERVNELGAIPSS